MVSPSKKRQIKGRVTTGSKCERKGDKYSSRLPYRPLLNKKFYLDVKGHKSTIATITADIHNLGGVVEKFLSREVDYVISSRGPQTAGGSSGEQQASPGGVPVASPLTPHQPLSSIPSTSHDSPLNIDSPREDTGKKRVRTRTEVLLERVCVRREGTSDVLENARTWNVPVWSLTKLTKWLSVLKENHLYRPPKTPTSARNFTTSSSAKVQRLKAPFIKIEAFSRQYKPIYKELSTWPELNLTSARGVSPFADPKQTKTRAKPKTSSAHRDDHRERCTKDRTRGVKVKDSGYCELCSTNYSSLRLHLQSDTHTAFVKNDKNYLFLDELINGHQHGGQIGETIHSGPTVLAQKHLKNEDVRSNSNCVFPGDTQESPRVLRHCDHPAEIPSTGHCSAPSPALPCPSHLLPQLSPAAAAAPCDVGTSLSPDLVPEALVPDTVVPKASVLEATIPQVTAKQAAVPCSLAVETDVPKGLVNKVNVSKVIAAETAVPVTIKTETSVPQDKVSETSIPGAVACKAAAAAAAATQKGTDDSAEAVVNQVSVSEDRVINTGVPEIKEHETFGSQDKVRDGDVPLDELNQTAVPQVDEAAVPEVKGNEAVIPELKGEEDVREVTVDEAAIPQDIVSEAALPEVKVEEASSSDVLLNEATLLEVIKTEAPSPEVPEIKAVTEEAVVGGEIVSESEHKQVAVLEALPSHPQSSLPVSTRENREMVRLIQEADADTFCQKRISRASRRLSSADFETLEIKSEPVSRAKRCTGNRKSSCRSDRSESETSDSRSVADEALYFDMVDKTAKRGKPKNGEPLLDEATTHISAKCNGDVSSELVNGAHKVKGRRISRVNSDESDSSSVSKNNGNIDQNGDKVDISVLLEISAADRKKFESKKAKIRRKTADWLLISETEQYYNEKEEIMRNKNKLDTDSESEDSDDGTENQDSKSDCSDESEGPGNPPRGKGKGRGKHSRTNDEDSKPSVKRLKDDPVITKKRGRPMGSRNRKTRYDLTMLNDDDDDDDDENFFGFPVSTNIDTAAGSSTSQLYGRGKGGRRRLGDVSPNGKSVRKRLSDAERFLRDNREYYHFQETTERLRRSTSSSGEKEKSTKGDEPEEKEVDKKEEVKPKETLSGAKRRLVPEPIRRVTRSTGGIVDDPEAEEKELKSVIKQEVNNSVKNDVRQSEKNEAKDKDKKRNTEEDDKRKGSGEKKKTVEDDRRKNNEEEKKKNTEEVKRRTSEEEKRKNSDEKKKKLCEDEKVKNTEEEKRSDAEDSKKKNTENNKRKEEQESKKKGPEVDKRKVVKEEKVCSESDTSSNHELLPKSKETSEERRNAQDIALDQLYFSFEAIPEQESWYQTYQRFIEGIAVNEFIYEQEPLKFVLPYEMPKEYVKDFLCYKKCLLSKKKNELADLVRKSPRCHASTLALFSDILPSKRAKSAKANKTVPVRIEEVSSDGTSTPGAESTRTQPSECFETWEELAILSLHMDHVMKSETGTQVLPVCSPQVADVKESEESDLKKTPPKKRGKKKRLLAGSKSNKVVDSVASELRAKLFESPLACEVDPVFIAGICDEVKDFLTPENILAREACEVIEDASLCVCTDQVSCDDFSSADDNTEASSECVSLCDSETIDGSVASEPKRGRSVKKRRKNLTGWPKAQKRKKPAPSHTSDDNDSSLGWDDLEPKKPGVWRKQEDFGLLEQTTTQRLAALAACERRASPRKKASVLYMDTWPVRFQTQK